MLNVKFRDEGERSFTLVELLIVIAILAVLAAAVVIVLNPAELVSQSRDSKRISDIKSIASAVDILIVDKTDPNLGDENFVFISLPDVNEDCSGISGLPVLPSGWAYRCVSPSDLTKINGDGWIPVDFTTINGGSPLSYLPLDPKNDINNFYQYVSSDKKYEVQALFESVKFQPTGGEDGGSSTRYEKGNNLSLSPYTTQDNWIKVPGNSHFGTSDFWTMKYEAKCVSSATNQPLTDPHLAFFYSNRDALCTSANGRYVASAPKGYPISFISHDQAKSYCQSLGAHLMTNEEYMTLARNVESVKNNWSGGSVGEGYLYAGNTGGHAVDLQASGSDKEGYFGVDTTTGPYRRTNTLTNGAVVWDLAGSVFEHVMRTMLDDKTQITIPSCTSTTSGLYFCITASMERLRNRI